MVQEFVVNPRWWSASVAVAIAVQNDRIIITSSSIVVLLDMVMVVVVDAAKKPAQNKLLFPTLRDGFFSWLESMRNPMLTNKKSTRVDRERYIGFPYYFIAPETHTHTHMYMHIHLQRERDNQSCWLVRPFEVFVACMYRTKNIDLVHDNNHLMPRGRDLSMRIWTKILAREPFFRSSGQICGPDPSQPDFQTEVGRDGPKAARLSIQLVQTQEISSLCPSL